MQHLRRRDYRQVPWQNGRGLTAEIAVVPEAAGADDFLWRLSMARVAEPGTFSAFPGVDRVLTVIEGDGLTLELEGRAPAPLGRDPFAFPGELPCSARLASGPVTDLNVMTRRGRCRAVVRWGPTDPVPGATDRLVFAAAGPLAGQVGDRRFGLGPRDTLWLHGAEAAELKLAGTWLDIQIIPGDLS